MPHPGPPLLTHPRLELAVATSATVYRLRPGRRQSPQRLNILVHGPQCPSRWAPGSDCGSESFPQTRPASNNQSPSPAGTPVRALLSGWSLPLVATFTRGRQLPRIQSCHGIRKIQVSAPNPCSEYPCVGFWGLAFQKRVPLLEEPQGGGKELVSGPQLASSPRGWI
ncbi:hypothetical protein VULLAG_LOCUS7346 [Vulpes lagopus]